jgi:RNA polymerase sigma-70 factor (ECF subfamily)
VFAPRVFRYLRFRVDGPETAEDLMQRVFVKMIEQLPAYRPSGAPFAAWLFRVARNAWIDQRRTSHATLSLDDLRAERATDPDLEDLTAATLDAAAIRRAVASLPAEQREVIACRFFADLTPRETAAVLGRSEGSVRVLQHRALGRLKRSLPGRDNLTMAGLTATEQ